MQRESHLILEVWDEVRDFIPPTKRVEVATAILLHMQDYGMEPQDMAEIVDEDPYLTHAFYDLFAEEELEREDELEDE